MVFFRPVTEVALRARLGELEKDCRDSFQKLPDLSQIRTALLQGFDHPVWEEITPTCIRCTGCTAVCPTCTCFQFNEERLDAQSGRRVRVKDSCQTAGFTRNAGWHNPRSKAAAVRHRIMDKLVYIQDRFGKKGCVGCGRCIDVCPAGIDIRKIADTVVKDCPPEGQRKPMPVSIPERASTRIDPQLFTPYPARIVAIHDETPDIRRYVVRYMDERLADGEAFLKQQEQEDLQLAKAKQRQAQKDLQKVRNATTRQKNKMVSDTARVNKAKAQTEKDLQDAMASVDQLFGVAGQLA